MRHEFRPRPEEDSPERPVQATRELGGIAHESAFISIPRVDELPLYGQDPPVHHVARGNAICAGFGVCKGNIGKAFDRRRGVDCPILVEDTTMSVRGVLAKANVTGDVEGWV